MRPAKPKTPKRCAVCGKPLPVVRRIDQRYCSPRCRQRAFLDRLRRSAP